MVFQIIIEKCILLLVGQNDTIQRSWKTLRLYHWNRTIEWHSGSSNKVNKATEWIISQSCVFAGYLLCKAIINAMYL